MLLLPVGDVRCCCFSCLSLIVDFVCSSLFFVVVCLLLLCVDALLLLFVVVVFVCLVYYYYYCGCPLALLVAVVAVARP